MRCAHSLKGSAANLGIKRVESRALQLELACNNSAGAATIDELLQKVSAELIPVISALQALPMYDFAHAAQAKVESLPAFALLKQLRDEWADDDSQAQDTKRRYLSVVGPLPGQLAKLVENFEFKSALELLNSAPQLS
jgi:HPt (histidine-containing phosphotransfer) domain-containing protein